uniref:Uncharacterized protein n=1 Tax=Amphimedon queenslandica TaxID=400682 RepID=A0A1X7ULP3_AMPQE
YTPSSLTNQIAEPTVRWSYKKRMQQFSLRAFPSLLLSLFLFQLFLALCVAS